MLMEEDVLNVVAVLYHVWRARNRAVWEGSLPCPRGVWRAAQAATAAWRHVHTASDHHQPAQTVTAPGKFRLRKVGLNELFWEAVWPCLLARGWHSEQPSDLSSAVAANVGGDVSPAQEKAVHGVVGSPVADCGVVEAIVSGGIGIKIREEKVKEKLFGRSVKSQVQHIKNHQIKFTFAASGIGEHSWRRRMERRRRRWCHGGEIVERVELIPNVTVWVHSSSTHGAITATRQQSNSTSETYLTVNARKVRVAANVRGDVAAAQERAVHGVVGTDGGVVEAIVSGGVGIEIREENIEVGFVGAVRTWENRYSTYGSKTATRKHINNIPETYLTINVRKVRSTLSKTIHPLHHAKIIRQHRKFLVGTTGCSRDYLIQHVSHQLHVPIWSSIVILAFHGKPSRYIYYPQHGLLRVTQQAVIVPNNTRRFIGAKLQYLYTGLSDAAPAIVGGDVAAAQEQAVHGVVGSAAGDCGVVETIVSGGIGIKIREKNIKVGFIGAFRSMQKDIIVALTSSALEANSLKKVLNILPMKVADPGPAPFTGPEVVDPSHAPGLKLFHKPLLEQSEIRCGEDFEVFLYMCLNPLCRACPK
nr:uncharacterized protein LOC109158686 [Ipomoea batatas]